MNSRELLQIYTPEYVMFLPVNQTVQAKLQRRLKPELKGAKVEQKTYPKDFAVEMGRLYRQDALARGILMPVTTPRLMDAETLRLMTARAEFLKMIADAQKFMEESGLHKTMPSSHQNISKILKDNA